MGIENHRIDLDSSVQKTGRELLDHQCWVLGRDVLSPWGNLLCEFGFKPVRCPNGGLTQYELHHALAEDSHVYLWGFGAFFGNQKEGIFLARNDFRPRQTVGRIELHSREHPDFLIESSLLEVFLRGVAWFAKYEDWIERHLPSEYRDECLATFPRKAIPRSEFADRWREIVQRIYIRLPRPSDGKPV
jgi:hypothetical protein